MSSLDIYSILSSKPHNPHYLKRYWKFIQTLLSQNINKEKYYELHHIAPKSTFPEFASHKENFIKLFPRQHFVAHWLLWKTFNSLEMSRAFHLMHNNSNTSYAYEIVRTEISNSMKGNRNFGSCKGELNGFYGKKHSEEFKIKHSKHIKDLYALGKIVSNFLGEDHKGELNGFYGKKHSEESLNKIKEAANNRSDDYYIKIQNKLKLRPKLICPHCFKECDERNAKRWHFSKCKSLR